MSESRRGWTAEEVRTLREQLRMTQRELAAELGVRQQTISEWETGIYQPRGASARMLRHVAERGASYGAARGSGQPAAGSRQADKPPIADE